MCFSAEIDQRLQYLSKRFKAEVDAGEYGKFQELKKKFPKAYKTPAEDNRIFPNTFAPVILLNEQQERIIKPMRYRVRPAHSATEIPAKYNVFNARVDSLEKRATWKKLFLRQHGLFPFKSFYEWVEDEHHKKVLINFRPQNRQIMWAPCLWDFYQDPETGKEFYSFAIITSDPPVEVQEMGHDRCPIFLQEHLIDEWLQSDLLKKKRAYELLQTKEDAYFENSLRA